MTLRNLSADRPNITLDFRKSKKLDPRITFTRASFAPASDPGSGTGNVGNGVNMFNVNVPRLTDQGLLIEESRTNYIADSSTLTGWGANSANSAVVASTTVCPDGSIDGIRITGTLANEGARKYFVATANNYTGSCYARSRTGSSQDVKIAFSGLNGPTQTLPASGEWVRIQGDPGIAVAAGNRYLLIAAVSNGTLDIDVWGEQVEIGSFPTSYIPTAGATVTRAADVCSITGDEFSSWYNQSEGSFSFIAPTLESTLANKGVVSTTSSSPTEGVQFWNSSGSGTRYRIYKAGTTEVDISTSTYEGAKWGWVYKTNDAALFKNGALLASDTSCAMPTAATSLEIGDDGVKHISRIAYYPARVSDSALQALTY